MSNKTLSSSFSVAKLPRKRSVMRATAINAGLIMLLAGVFAWSVAGNAIDTLRHAIERH